MFQGLWKGETLYNGETLYIEIPKLSENLVIVPGSVYITFDMVVTGHKDNTLVNNLGRNLISQYKVLFGVKS